MTLGSGEYELELPIGLTDGDGVVHRRAIVRKMRGHEESLLYERELNPPELVSHIIAGTLLRLGGLERPGPEVAERMYSADRNQLLLQVRRLTFGDSMTASYSCPACAAEVRTMERLDAMPVRSMEADTDPESLRVALEDGYTDRSGVEHHTLTLRLPRGQDEAFVSPMAERDPVKAADALVLRCVRAFGTLPVSELQAYGLRILRDLTWGDRVRIQRTITDDAPGPQLRRSVRCEACGTRFERLLDVSDFFVPCWAEDTASGKRSSTSPTTSIGAGTRS